MAALEKCQGFDSPNESYPPPLPLGDVDPKMYQLLDRLFRNRKRDIMYRLALESLENEAKLLLRPGIKMGFAGSGEIKNLLVHDANQQERNRSVRAQEVCP